MQGSRWKRLVVGKRSEPGEMREPVAWGGEEEEGRKKDGEQGEWIHPSVTLWQTARESQCEASPLSSSRLSARPSVRPPVRPSLSLSPHVRPPSLSACPSDRLFVCLLSLSSPAFPDASLASGIHLLSCPVPCPPPPLLLLFPPSSSLPPPSHHRSYTRHPSFSFSISLDFFKILSSGSLERDRNRDREEGWILESSAYHMRNEHYSHSGTLRTRTISWMGFRECGGGKGARKGREKGCWKRAELGVHRWSALGPLLGSGPIPTDPRMPFASRGPPVVVFLVLVVDAVILAILSSPSSLREREGLPSNRSRPSGGLWLEGPWTAPGRERQWTMGT